jgi:hypothetical protein
MIWLRAADRSCGNSRLGSRCDIAVGGVDAMYRPAATTESDSLLDYTLVTGPDGGEAGGQPAYQVSAGCRVVSKPWPTASC